MSKQIVLSERPVLSVTDILTTSVIAIITVKVKLNSCRSFDSGHLRPSQWKLGLQLGSGRRIHHLDALRSCGS